MYCVQLTMPCIVMTLGLVRYAFRLLDKDLPLDPHEARHLAVAVDDAPRPFDIAYFRFSSLEERHVGLVLDAGCMIHAADKTYGVSTIRMGRLRTVTLLRHKDLLE